VLLSYFAMSDTELAMTGLADDVLEGWRWVCAGQFRGRCRRGARGADRERRVRGVSSEFLWEFAKKLARKTRNRTRRSKARARIVGGGGALKKLAARASGASE
jgi:hypothetical protein